jgi:hypothetical protein
MPTQPLPETPPFSIACKICGKEMKLVSVEPTENTIYAFQCVKGHRRELVTAGGKISRLYRILASEYFNRAAIPEQADSADALRRMGRCYISEASFLDPSLSDPPPTLLTAP